MSDKDFKVKNKLQVKGITSAGPVVSDASGNLDSTAYVATQYGGTGTSTSPSSGQILYSSSGTTYAPTGLSSLTISSSGGSTITNNSASAIGLVIKGAASQTANLQEWQNNSGTVLSKIRSDGQFYGYGSQYGGSQYGSIGPLGLAVGGQSGETSIHYDYGNFTVRSSTTGEASSGSAWANNASALIGTGYAGGIGLIIKSVASQTADLQQWQNSAGAIIASIGPVGDVSVNGSIYTNNAYFGGAASYYNATINIRPQQTSYKGIVIQGRASQTGNLQEWQNSSANILAQVDAYGSASFGGNNILGSSLGIGVGGNASQKGITVRGTASQTANLTEWQDSAGTIYAFINPFGQLSIGLSPTIYGNSRISINTVAATAVGQVIRGVVSQTADLQQWQNSAGTVLSRVASNGVIKANVGLVAENSTLANYTALQVNSTITNGNGIIVVGASGQTANLQEWQNSSGTVLAKINGVGQFVSDVGFAVTAGNYGGAVGYLQASSASYVGLIIKAAASQTANLQEWQNSSGTVLASISAAGNLTVQDLTVNGTATTINSTTLTIDDKNIELASVASPTDTTADGAGITIKGATDKTFNWVQSTGSFTSSEPISTPALSVFGNSVSSNITLAAGKRYFVDTTAARTLTLPASPTLGDEIQVFDASNLAGTNNITLGSNSGKINGVVQDAILDTNGGATTLIYTGSSYGWRFE